MISQNIHIENVDQAEGIPRYHIDQLIGIISQEFETHDLQPGTIISIGDYGHLRIELDPNAESPGSFVAVDIDSGSRNANGFLQRYIALRGFEHMDDRSWNDALECFDYALNLNPYDAVLLQSRASVKQEILNSTQSDQDAARLLMELINDLLRSIELDPDRASSYDDLYIVLQGFRSVEGDADESRVWKSEIVELALSSPARDEVAIQARNKLKEFQFNAG